MPLGPLLPIPTCTHFWHWQTSGTRKEFFTTSPLPPGRYALGEQSLTDMVPSDWTPRLASAIAGALRELAPHVGTEPLAMLALDCHPWHGSIGIAALTAKEVAADKAFDNPAEMAAWRFFDFASEFDSWHPTTALGQEMKAAYYSGDRPAVVEAFLSACAAAITSDVVAQALDGVIRVDGFRLSAAHPDNGREFVSGVGRA